jgi:TolB-like protein/Tfp pilus assembly protein PilF
MSLFKELQRRNVFRVAAAYVVVAWLLIQVGATLEPAMHLPDWVDSVLAFFLLLGFPVALFMAWAYELTPDGLKQDSEVSKGDPARAVASRKWDRMIIAVLLLALGYFAVDRFLMPNEAPGRDMTAQQTPGAEQDAPAPVEAVPKSIAVLPFVNMSSDPEQEYFSDGLTEELLNLLAGIEELKVAARTSSFYYKDKLDAVTLDEVARQLEVAHILEGSVRKGGDQVRITAQLIKAEDGFHLWSATYDRKLDDIFAIQDEIAAAVVDALKVTLLGDAPHVKVIDTESYELALHGRHLFNRRAPGDLEDALSLFERAVELDTANAMAWTGMAPIYLWIFDPPHLEDALHATARAMELEPDNPEVLVRRAQSLWYSGSTEEAWETWQKAQDLGQENQLVLSMSAGMAQNKGLLDRTIDLQRKALRLDPLHTTNVSNMASYLVRAGRFEEAAQWADRFEQLGPGHPSAALIRAEISLFTGDAAAAKQYFSRSSGNIPESRMDGDLYDTVMHSSILFSTGDHQGSLELLEQFKAELGDSAPVYVAWMHAWRGEHDEAFEWLARAIDGVDDFPADELLSPFLYGLHDDPRWDVYAEYIRKRQES